MILASWHEHLCMMPAVWAAGRAINPALQLNVLTSRHKDGRLIGDILARLGIGIVHGSSSRNGQDRGGARSVIALLASLKSGSSIGITPDGPRGPRRQSAPGVAQLAALSGCPVLPVAGSSTHRRILGSWDRMILPLPFGRGVLVCGAPVPVPRHGWEHACEDITDALNAVSAEAERQCR
jgi:lysophospholipid acyltransferase (LPLAT)-like uncharacterized protein